MKNTQQLDYPTMIDRKSIFVIEKIQTKKINKAQQKRQIIAFCSLALLGVWITLCSYFYSYFLKEALVSSAIISAVIFLRTVDADTSNEFSNQKN